MKRTATAITQNPYIDLVDSDDDDEDDNQPDVRIFQAPPGHPLYLQPKDEVKARNGYIFTKFDNERKKNTEIHGTCAGRASRTRACPTDESTPN